MRDNWNVNRRDNWIGSRRDNWIGGKRDNWSGKRRDKWSGKRRDMTYRCDLDTTNVQLYSLNSTPAKIEGTYDCGCSSIRRWVDCGINIKYCAEKHLCLVI
jgi:hypothetical protein